MAFVGIYTCCETWEQGHRTFNIAEICCFEVGIAHAIIDAYQGRQHKMEKSDERDQCSPFDNNTNCPLPVPDVTTLGVKIDLCHASSGVQYPYKRCFNSNALMCPHCRKSVVQ